MVWGDGNFGLSHIVNRREEDFIKQGLNKIEAKNKALNFIKEIENIINNGNVKKVIIELLLMLRIVELW